MQPKVLAQSSGLFVAAAILLGGVIVSLRGSAETSTADATTATTQEQRTVPIRFPKEALNQNWEETGWGTIDLLGRQKGIYQHLGILKEDAAGTIEWTDEALRELVLRREHAREFAAANTPRITVIGQIHQVGLEKHTPEMGENVDQAQAWVYKKVIEHAAAESVLFTEGILYDGTRVSPDRLSEISDQNHQALEGETVKQEYGNKDAIMAVLAYHPELPIFGAESWPLYTQFQTLRFQRDILQGVLGERYWETHDHDHGLTRRGVDGLNDEDRGRYEMSRSLDASLTWLRSELAVIIILEHFAKHGGEHAIIVMGDTHTSQIEKVGTNYGADMETFSPPEEYFHHGHNHDGR